MGLIEVLIIAGVVIFIFFVAGILTARKDKNTKDKQEI
jgi:hypothetical protein